MISRALVAGGLLLTFSLFGRAHADFEQFKRHQDHVLGTSFDMVVLAPVEADADAAERAALDEIKRLEAILSTYSPDSQISRLQIEQENTVAPELIDVLSACEIYKHDTENSFSCRIAPLLDVWSTAENTGDIPDSAQLRLLAGEIRRADVTIDASTNTISFDAPIAFNVNALAKGYVIDAALNAARQAAPSAKGILVNIGGDIALWGEGAHEGKWTASIPDTDAVLSLRDGAVATSGTGPRSKTIAGRNFSHIIAPADGWPVDHVTSASVFAATAFEADALATLLNVLPIGDGLARIEALDGTEARITASDGRTYVTSGWASLMNISAADVGAGEAHVSLSANFQIPEKDVSDYERPYIAAWISDDKRNLIRILMLAGDEPRWMEENYYWFRRFGRKAGSLVDTESGPTRRPGAYTLDWDGTDHDGAPVPAGEYIFHIEAAREHGGHQHERIPFSLGGAPVSANLPEGEELGPVTLTVGSAR